MELCTLLSNKLPSRMNHISAKITTTKEQFCGNKVQNTRTSSDIQQQTNTTDSVNCIQHTEETTHLDQMEATLQNLSEQLLAPNTPCQDSSQSFNYGKLAQGHMTRNCAVQRAPPMTVTYFKFGNIGQPVHNYRSQQQGNGQGGAPTCLHNTTHSCIQYGQNQ